MDAASKVPAAAQSQENVVEQADSPTSLSRQEEMLSAVKLPSVIQTSPMVRASVEAGRRASTEKEQPRMDPLSKGPETAHRHAPSSFSASTHTSLHSSPLPLPSTLGQIPRGGRLNSTDWGANANDSRVTGMATTLSALTESAFSASQPFALFSPRSDSEATSDQYPPLDLLDRVKDRLQTLIVNQEALLRRVESSTFQGDAAAARNASLKDSSSMFVSHSTESATTLLGDGANLDFSHETATQHQKQQWGRIAVRPPSETELVRAEDEKYFVSSSRRQKNRIPYGNSLEDVMHPYGKERSAEQVCAPRAPNDGEEGYVCESPAMLTTRTAMDQEMYCVSPATEVLSERTARSPINNVYYKVWPASQNSSITPVLSPYEKQLESHREEHISTPLASPSSRNNNGLPWAISARRASSANDRSAMGSDTLAALQDNLVSPSPGSSTASQLPPSYLLSISITPSPSHSIPNSLRPRSFSDRPRMLHPGALSAAGTEEMLYSVPSSGMYLIDMKEVGTPLNQITIRELAPGSVHSASTPSPQARLANLNESSLLFSGSDDLTYESLVLQEPNPREPMYDQYLEKKAAQCGVSAAPLAAGGTSGDPLQLWKLTSDGEGRTILCPVERTSNALVTEGANTSSLLPPSDSFATANSFVSVSSKSTASDMVIESTSSQRSSCEIQTTEFTSQTLVYHKETQDHSVDFQTTSDENPLKKFGGADVNPPDSPTFSVPSREDEQPQPPPQTQYPLPLTKPPLYRMSASQSTLYGYLQEGKRRMSGMKYDGDEEEGDNVEGGCIDDMNSSLFKYRFPMNITSEDVEAQVWVPYAAGDTAQRRRSHTFDAERDFDPNGDEGDNPTFARTERPGALQPAATRDEPYKNRAQHTVSDTSIPSDTTWTSSSEYLFDESSLSWTDRSERRRAADDSVRGVGSPRHSDFKRGSRASPRNDGMHAVSEMAGCDVAASRPCVRRSHPSSGARCGDRTLPPECPTSAMAAVMLRQSCNEEITIVTNPTTEVEAAMLERLAKMHASSFTTQKLTQAPSQAAATATTTTAAADNSGKDDIVDAAKPESAAPSEFDTPSPRSAETILLHHNSLSMAFCPPLLLHVPQLQASTEEEANRQFDFASAAAEEPQATATRATESQPESVSDNPAVAHVEDASHFTEPSGSQFIEVLRVNSSTTNDTTPDVNASSKLDGTESSNVQNDPTQKVEAVIHTESDKQSADASKSEPINKEFQDSNADDASAAEALKNGSIVSAFPSAHEGDVAERFRSHSQTSPLYAPAKDGASMLYRVRQNSDAEDAIRFFGISIRPQSLTHEMDGNQDYRSLDGPFRLMGGSRSSAAMHGHSDGVYHRYNGSVSSVSQSGALYSLSRVGSEQALNPLVGDRTSFSTTNSDQRTSSSHAQSYTSRKARNASKKHSIVGFSNEVFDGHRLVSHSSNENDFCVALVKTEVSSSCMAPSTKAAKRNPSSNHTPHSSGSNRSIHTQRYTHSSAKRSRCNPVRRMQQRGSYASTISQISFPSPPRSDIEAKTSQPTETSCDTETRRDLNGTRNLAEVRMSHVEGIGARIRTSASMPHGSLWQETAKSLLMSDNFDAQCHVAAEGEEGPTRTDCAGTPGSVVAKTRVLIKHAPPKLGVKNASPATLVCLSSRSSGAKFKRMVARPQLPVYIRHEEETEPSALRRSEGQHTTHSDASSSAIAPNVEFTHQETSIFVEPQRNPADEATLPATDSGMPTQLQGVNACIATLCNVNSMRSVELEGPGPNEQPNSAARDKAERTSAPHEGELLTQTLSSTSERDLSPQPASEGTPSSQAMRSKSLDFTAVESHPRRTSVPAIHRDSSLSKTTQQPQPQPVQTIPYTVSVSAPRTDGGNRAQSHGTQRRESYLRGESVVRCRSPILTKRTFDRSPSANATVKPKPLVSRSTPTLGAMHNLSREMHPGNNDHPPARGNATSNKQHSSFQRSATAVERGTRKIVGDVNGGRYSVKHWDPEAYVQRRTYERNLTTHTHTNAIPLRDAEKSQSPGSTQVNRPVRRSASPVHWTNSGYKQVRLPSPLRRLATSTTVLARYNPKSPKTAALQPNHAHAQPLTSRRQAKTGAPGTAATTAASKPLSAFTRDASRLNYTRLPTKTVHTSHSNTQAHEVSTGKSHAEGSVSPPPQHARRKPAPSKPAATTVTTPKEKKKKGKMAKSVGPHA